MAGNSEVVDAIGVIRKKRLTDDGKACVSVAEWLLEQSIDNSAEARQWVKLGLDCDNATTPAELKRLREAAEKRSKTSKKLAELAGSSGLKAIPGGAS